MTEATELQLAIVIKIQHDVDATFNFTKHLEEKISLNICAENLLKILSGSADADGSISEIKSGNELNIQCHFESDLLLPCNVKAPTTYREAMEFAKNFTQILSDSISKDTRNQPVGVPCVVWLHPLVQSKVTHQHSATK
jgi:hypothetical protein